MTLNYFLANEYSSGQKLDIEIESLNNNGMRPFLLLSVIFSLK